MHLRALVSRLSISTRLTLWFWTSLLVLLILFVAGLYVSVHLELLDDLEARLREDAAAVQAHHEAHGFVVAGTSSSTSHELQSTSGTFVRLLGSGATWFERALRPVAALTTAASDMQDRPTGTLPTDFGVERERPILRRPQSSGRGLGN